MAAAHDEIAAPAKANAVPAYCDHDALVTALGALVLPEGTGC